MLNLQKKVTNLIAWLVSGGLVIAGLSLIISATAVPCVWLSEVMKAVGGTILGTGALSLIWEVFAKREFRDETLSLVQVGAALDKAGVEVIELNYLDVEWKGLFTGAERMDVFFTYAGTWRSAHLQSLRELVAKDKRAIRVLVPDPDFATGVAELTRRFVGYTPEKTAGLIREGIEAFKELRAGCGLGTTIEIRVTRNQPVYAMYLFGHKAVFTMYRHQPGKGAIPTYIVRASGTLYAFLEADFNSLWNAATVVEG